MINRKEGQLRRIFSVVVLVLLLVTLIVAAESIDEETSMTQETQTTEVQENMGVVEDNLETINSEVNTENLTTETEENVTEIIDLCENINCDASNLICVDGFDATCENFCIQETGMCTSCNSSCEGHEQIIGEIIENETEIIENETEIIIVDNSSVQQDLDVQIFYPNKTTRGEIMELKVIITNSGNATRDVVATWDLPPEFEIVSGDKMGNCENLNTGESCELIIKIQSSFSASLGNSEIKISVNYKNGI